MKNVMHQKTQLNDIKKDGRAGCMRNLSVHLDNNCIGRNCQVTILEFWSLFEGMQLLGEGLDDKSCLIVVNFNA